VFVDWITIREEEAGERIDKLLAARYRDSQSRSYFQFLINQGCVRIDGVPVKKQTRPEAGSDVEVQFLLTPEIDLEPEPIPLAVLYEDEALIAIDKPPGMVVHPAPGNWSGTFVNALLYHCRSLQEGRVGSRLRPGIVHRLDKETSGVLVAAKTEQAHRALVSLFSEREVKKEYCAICVGNPGSGTITTRIGRHPLQRKQMASLEEGGREAVTRFETIAHDASLSVVRAFPLTGRTHQIRVHLKAKNAPILGDPLYGSAGRNKKFGAPRLLLHAEKLAFPHPVTGAPVLLEAPLPDDIKKYKEKICGS